jgi:hypothetical protein
VKDIATLLLLLSLCPAARAGLVFEETTSYLASRGQPPLTMRASFDDGKLEIQFVDNRAFPVIFRDGALYMLNPVDRTYNVLDRGAMAQLGANDAAARKRSEENMEKLTPAQRAMIQPVLDVQAQKLAEERQPLDLRRTDRHESVLGHRCVVWLYYLEGKMRAEACIASPSAFADGAEMLRAMVLVSDFLVSARQSLGEAAVLLFQVPSYRLRMQATVSQQLGGLVLQWREFSHDKPAEETALTAVRAEAPDPSIFAIPTGYTEQSLSSASHVH